MFNDRDLLGNSRNLDTNVKIMSPENPDYMELIKPEEDLDIQSLSPSIQNLVNEDLMSSLSKKEKDELRELSRQLAKNPKMIDYIKQWIAKKSTKK